MKISYIFEDERELLDFIIWEVKKYTGCNDLSRVLFAYNRLTVEELAQEVYLKLLKTVSSGMNKSYVRQAVVFVCIDEYRRYRLYDNPNAQESQDTLESCEAEVYQETERLRHLRIFSERELEVMELLLLGHRNPEVREILKIPKMSYYTLLNRIKLKYI